MSKIEGLWSKGKTFKIGKDLPDEERVEVTVYDISLEDYAFVAMRLSKLQDDSVDATEKQDILVDFIAKATRLPREDVLKINMDYLEEIMDATTSVMETDERKKRASARLAGMKKDG